jgi:hypothetical protein
VYLWNIYIPVALPVVATTSVAVLMYGLTTILPLIYEHCPYTTTSSRLIGSWIKIVHVYLCPRYKAARSCILRLKRKYLSDFYSPWQKTKRQINRKWPWQKQARKLATTRIAGGISYLRRWLMSVASRFAQNSTRARKWDLPQSLEPQKTTLVPITPPFADPESLMANGEVPMDLTTSEMLAWLLTNCEDPRHIALTVQSLAGAEPWLPRLPLLENGILRHVYQCLDGCFEADSQETAFSLKSLVLPDLACLYLRALNFLFSYHNYEGFYCSEVSEQWHYGILYLHRYSELENTWHQSFETGLTALALQESRGWQWYAFLGRRF